MSRFALPALFAAAASAPVAAQQPFGGLSLEGRQALAAAMVKESVPGHDEAVRRARMRVLELLAADELDLDAIAEAQATERQLVQRDHARAQARMRDAYAELSREDRQAFAAAMATREARIRRRMQLAQDRVEMLDTIMRRHAERASELRRGGGRAGIRQVADE
ncbi:MAG: hypothetical protein AAF205_04085 [Pseudomonadota bacterium]